MVCRNRPNGGLVTILKSTFTSQIPRDVAARLGHEAASRAVKACARMRGLARSVRGCTGILGKSNAERATDV